MIGMNTAVAGTLVGWREHPEHRLRHSRRHHSVASLTLMAGESVVTHGAFIGVEIESLTPSLQQSTDSPSPGGSRDERDCGNRRSRAGVEQGDIIVGINNTTIDSAQDVSAVISSLHPGHASRLHIVRGTKHIVSK